MARLTIRIDVGPGVSLGAVSSVVEDLSALHQLGVRVDQIAARRDAETTVERWWRDSPGQILERSNRFDEEQLAEWQQLLAQREHDDELRQRIAEAPPEFWFDEWYRWRRRYLANTRAGRAVPPPAPWSLTSESRLAEVAPGLFSQLVNGEAARLMPPIPSVERLTYENPVELILIGVGVLTGAGFKFGTFTELAKLIRDWSSEKQLNEARAREAAAQAEQAEVRVENERASVERTRAETRELHARANKAEIEAEVMRRYALQGGRADDLVRAGLALREIEAIAQLTTGEVEVETDEDDR